jgi:hypothetical protein
MPFAAYPRLSRIVAIDALSGRRGERGAGNEFLHFRSPVRDVFIARHSQVTLQSCKFAG